MYRLIFLILLSLFVSGCANPLNRVTSDRYAQICADAEQAGNMEIATEACYRAYINVEWGNLGPELMSERLYNFGRVLRMSGRFEAAKEALQRALKEEETLSGKTSIKSGRRMAELAATFYELDQVDDGLPLVDRLIPLAENYTESEKQFIATVLYRYGSFLKKNKQIEKAITYDSKINDLGYPVEFFDKVGNQARGNE